MDITVKSPVLNAVHTDNKVNSKLLFSSQKPVIKKISKDSFCFAGDVNLAEKLEAAQQKLTIDTDPAIVQDAKKLASLKPENMWGNYRAMTFKYKKHLPDVCFVSLAENVVKGLKRKDTSVERFILKYLESRNNDKLGFFDRTFDKIIGSLGIENKKASLLSISKIYASEASDNQREYLKAYLESEKDAIFKATNSKGLKVMFDRLVEATN